MKLHNSFMLNMKSLLLLFLRTQTYETETINVWISKAITIPWKSGCFRSSIIFRSR